MDCTTYTTYLEYAVLGDDLHWNVSISAVGQQIEGGCQVDKDTKNKVDNTRTTVENNFDDP